MRMMTKVLAGATGLAAFAAAVPAAAQYSPYNYSQPQYGYATRGYSTPYQPNAYGQYGYTTPYASNGYSAYGMNSNAAAQQCTAAVQNRLYNRTSLGSILGSLVGVPMNTQGRVVAITSAQQTSSGLRVRGLASSGRYVSNGYSPYGVGAYGALGYNTNQAADLSFRCDVDYRGYVRNISINRR